MNKSEKQVPHCLHGKYIGSIFVSTKAVSDVAYREKYKTMTTRREINNARNEALRAMVTEVTGPAKLALEVAQNDFEKISGRYPGAGNEGHEEWLVEARAARQATKDARDAVSEAEAEMVRQDAVIRAKYSAMIKNLGL